MRKSENYLLGIDLGTSAVKAALFDTEGTLCAHGTAEYPTIYRGGTWVEQEPAEWWSATCAAVREALSLCDSHPEQVRAVAVSSQAPTMLPLDKSGAALRPALIWMDQRAQRECAHLAETIGNEEVFRITGNSIDSYYVLPELLWFRENEPELFGKTHVILQANAFINYKLTEVYATDRPHAGLTMMYDRTDGTWSDRILSAVGLTESILPPIHESHEVIGEVTAAASERVGLAAGTPVVAGTVDGCAAALEAGVVEAGTVCDMTGTSTVLLAVVQQGVSHQRLTWLPHAVPGGSLLIGTMSSTGGSLKWFRDALGQSERLAAELMKTDAYELMNSEVASLRDAPSGVIYLPYLSGERSPIWNSNARGVFFGLHAQSSRADMIRAIMEGAAYGIRHNLDVLADAGVVATELRAVGGGAKSDVWNQIKADVTGIPVVVPQSSIGAPLGDAMIAAAGVGLVSDIREGVDAYFKSGRHFEPRPSQTEAYAGIYAIFRRLYDHLMDDFDALQALHASGSAGS